MKELENLVNELIEKKKEKEKERVANYNKRWSLVKENLISFLEKLEPYRKVYGKLRKMYGYYEGYVLETERMSSLKLVFSDDAQEFVLLDNCARFNQYHLIELKNADVNKIIFWFGKYNISETQKYEWVYKDVIKDIENWIEKLKKEVE